MQAGRRRAAETSRGMAPLLVGLSGALLLAAAQAAASAPAPETSIDYEDTWVLRYVAAMPDGFPRQVIAATPKRDLVPLHVDPLHPWNDTLRVEPDVIALPGPEVRVRQGGRVRITIENRLHTPVSIHWHGIHMKRQGWYDGAAGWTECGIPPYDTFVYDFVVDQEPGTHWWHAHNKAEFVDGLFGAIIVDPPEGVVDPINERWGITPENDQMLFVGDWSHESWEENEQKYLGRQGEYPGYEADHRQSQDPTLPHLPDYPWPTHSVVLNGRGQFPCEGKYVTEADCRIIREWGWTWWENQSMPRPPINPDRQNFCRGQCNPVREPYVGGCGVTPPSTLQCDAGGYARLRLINSGAGLPMRVWIDRHKITIVARDGLPVQDSGPHFAVLLHSGIRYDLIVHCDQTADVGSVFKVLSAFAIEFYPGISQRFSAAGWFPLAGYALLEYSNKLAGAEPPAPEHPPESWHPFRNGTMDVSLYESYGPDFNTCHGPRGGGPTCQPTYLPSYLEMGLKPLAETVAEPAVERIEVHTKIYGNWWNHLVNTTHYNGPLPTRGLRLEWWEVDGHAPLYQPSEPVLLTKGHLNLPLSDERSFGPIDERLMPYIAKMEYDPVNPRWYECVIFNYEGQNHPYHLHGFHVHIIGYNYTETRMQMQPNFDPEAEQLIYDPALYGIPDLGEAAPSIMADTFTIPYFGFVVLRIRSDNPGIWLFHCHMDYHLAAGMGFVLDVQQSGGGYGLGPPPNGMPMCNAGASWGGPGEGEAAASSLAVGGAVGASGLWEHASGLGKGWHAGSSSGLLGSTGLVLVGTALGYALAARAGAPRGGDGFAPMPIQW